MPDLPLDSASYMSFSTFRKNGDEVKTPVWFAGSAGKYFVFSNGNAGKVKRLRNSARARVAPCNLRGDVLGAWQDAQAIILTEPADCARAEAALAKKYGWQFAGLDFFAALFGRKKQRAYIVVRT